MEIHHHQKEKRQPLGRIWSLLYGKAVIKVPVAFLAYVFLISLLSLFIEPGSRVFPTLSFGFSTVLGAYLLGYMVIFTRRSFHRLLSARSITGIFISYFAFLFVVVLLFSNVYEISESLELGYLTYGTCSDGFDPSMIEGDPQRSDSFFYFTTTTMFGVGGEICPMGMNKNIALFNAFIGNFMFTVIMVIVVSSFVNRYLISHGMKAEDPPEMRMGEPEILKQRERELAERHSGHGQH